jgi:hypothetical protein
MSLALIRLGGTKRSRPESPVCGAPNSATPSKAIAGASSFDLIVIGFPKTSFGRSPAFIWQAATLAKVRFAPPK